MTTQKNPWEERQLSLFGDDDTGNEETQVYENEEAALDEIMDRRAGSAAEEEEGGSACWAGFEPEAAGKSSPAGTAEAAPSAPAEADTSSGKSMTGKKHLSPRVLRRAALAFLASKKPDGLAVGVYVPALHAPADAVSFSLSGGSVSETKLALASSAPARLAMPSAKRERLDRLIREQEALKASLEETIRETEPNLNASLFAETAEWEYGKSENAKYHRCLRKLEKLRYERQYSGKLERLLAEKTADELYLILPEGADYSAVPQEWGIVLLAPDLTLHEVRGAANTGSDADARALLATAAAVAARENVLFANGIRLEDGRPLLTPVPRRRPASR